MREAGGPAPAHRSDGVARREPIDVTATLRWSDQREGAATMPDHDMRDLREAKEDLRDAKRSGDQQDLRQARREVRDEKDDMRDNMRDNMRD
jgi:hypothetical protein